MVSIHEYCDILQFKSDTMQNYIDVQKISSDELQSRHIEIIEGSDNIVSEHFNMSLEKLHEIEEHYKYELTKPEVQEEVNRIMNGKLISKRNYDPEKIIQANSLFNNPIMYFIIRLFAGKEKAQAMRGQIREIATTPTVAHALPIEESNNNHNNKSTKTNNMISIETYALLSASMAGAMTDRDLQIAYCEANGITIEEWDEGSAHYMQLMMNPSESAKVISAITTVAMSGKKPIDPRTLPKGTPKPQNFAAAQLQAWVDDEIQNVLIKNNDLYIQFQLMMNPDPNDEFMANYVRGRVHISINGQDYSLYGGVSSVSMERDSILLVFDDEGKERMGMDEFKVTFDIHAKKFNQLRYVMAGIYGDTFTRSSLDVEEVFTFGNIHYDFTWQEFQKDEMHISIRPNLQNFKETGEFNLIAMPKYILRTTNNPEMEIKLFQHALDAWVIYLEMDMTSVVSMVIETPEHYQVYIYSKLPQNDFMQRMNESSAFTPAIPLDFDGGTDAAWENYTNCLNDFHANKN